MNDSEVYAPPQVESCEQSSLPEAYGVGGPSAKVLRRCGWIAILETILLLPTLGLSVMAGFFGSNNYYQVFSEFFEVFSVAVWLYTFIVFKQFVNARFGFQRANRLFNLMIIGSVASVAFTFVDPLESEAFGFWDMSYLATLAVFGVVSIRFGRVLLKIEEPYRYLKAYAWLSVFMGVCLASIVLLLLIIPLAIASNILMVLFFFHAAKEVSDGNKS